MTTAGGVLARSVTMRDKDTFQLVTFPAGSTPPAWASALITNPSAWESAPAPTPEGEGEDEDLIGDPASSSLQDETADPGQGTEDGVSAPETETQELPEPPKNGAGSGRDAWVAYANSKHVTFAEDASRAEIIAAVEAAE